MDDSLAQILAQWLLNAVWLFREGHKAIALDFNCFVSHFGFQLLGFQLLCPVYPVLRFVSVSRLPVEPGLTRFTRSHACLEVGPTWTLDPRRPYDDPSRHR